MTRIAVVNDDTVFLDMMAAVLRERSWEVDVYREGDTAFEQLRASPPDVIILDIRMEKPETGWTVLELLTLDPQTASVPVIVCSAAITDLQAHEGVLKKYGIAVLPKPFDMATLYAQVDEALAVGERPQRGLPQWGKGATERLDDSQGGLQESYDRIAEEYARRIYGELEHKPLDRALLDYFAEEMRDRGVIADIGCGPGHVGRYLFDRGLPVEGLDLSPGMVRMATQLNPGMRFRQGSMLDLDVQDGAWAGIVAFYSIIHVPPEDLPRVFSEFYRAVSPGGMVLVAFHAGTKHIHLDEWWEHDVSVNTYFFRTDQIERMLGDAGFAVWAHLERRPNEAVEHPSDRGYVIARKDL